MPTLDITDPEPTDHWDRVARIRDGATRAIGADHRVRLRVLLCMAVVAISLTLTPTPWSAIGMVALLLVALDWTRK